MNHTVKINDETITFRPQGNGTVIIDHRYPSGIKGVRGVARFGRVVSTASARSRWSSAIKAGWVAA